MIVRCLEEDQLEEILDYLEKIYIEAPYFYINLKKYGLGNQNVKLWLDIEEEIKGAYLLYFDCMHFVAKDKDYDPQVFLNMVILLAPKVIMLPLKWEYLREKTLTNYKVEYNHTIEIAFNTVQDAETDVFLAKREELEEIVNLTISDKEFKDIYEKDVLLKQFYSRYDEKFSRFFIMKKDKKIISSYCTYGELEHLAVTGGLITHPDYRGQGNGQKIIYQTWKRLAGEGKRVISFVNSKNIPSLTLHKKCGCQFISGIYKLVRI